jgi:spermidine synthase
MPGAYDAILLDVDNGPIALAHDANDALYGHRGIDEAHAALRPGGVLAVWSLLDDPRFTKRLERHGFSAKAHRVFGSNKGRGRTHVVWVAKRSSSHPR